MTTFPSPDACGYIRRRGLGWRKPHLFHSNGRWWRRHRSWFYDQLNGQHHAVIEPVRDAPLFVDVTIERDQCGNIRVITLPGHGWS